MPKTKPADFNYLHKLHNQVINRTRRARPAFPYEQDTLVDMAKGPLSPEAYREALNLWRAIASLHDQVELNLKAGQDAPHHHKAYTELLWYVAPLVLQPTYLTPAVATEVVGHGISWHAASQYFDEALGAFFRAPDLPGLDYAKLWGLNIDTKPYLAHYLLQDGWPSHRPISWAIGVLDLTNLQRADYKTFFASLQGPKINEFLQDLNPGLAPPFSLLTFLKDLRPAQWSALNRTTIGKLLQIQDPEIRLLSIQQGLGAKTPTR